MILFQVENAWMTSESSKQLISEYIIMEVHGDYNKKDGLGWSLERYINGW